MSEDLFQSVAALRLGAADPPRQLSQSAQHFSVRQSTKSLIVKRLHRSQQICGLRNLMFDLWKLEGRGSTAIQDDGTIQFFFNDEHRLMHVLEEATWTYRGWLVAVDLWSNHSSPTYLSQVLLWIKVLNVPAQFRNYPTLMEIGASVGSPEETRFRQPSRSSPAEAWVRIRVNIHSHFQVCSTVSIFRRL